MTSRNDVFSATHLGGLQPGVLDPTQPARILRNPGSALSFATYDPLVYAPDVAIPPHTRIVIEHTPGSGQTDWFRVVPSARLAPGVLGEDASWPRVIFLDGKTVICEREQWDIYKLDPAYDCYIPAPPAFPTITWVGHPSQPSRPPAGSGAPFVHPVINDPDGEAPLPEHMQRGDQAVHQEPVFTSSASSAASTSSAGFASSTNAASSTSRSFIRSFERSEHFSDLLRSSMFKSFMQARQTRPSRSPTPADSPSSTRTLSSSSTAKPTLKRSTPHIGGHSFTTLHSESSFGEASATPPDPFGDSPPSAGPSAWHSDDEADLHEVPLPMDAEDDSGTSTFPSEGPFTAAPSAGPSAWHSDDEADLHEVPLPMDAEDDSRTSTFPSEAPFTAAFESSGSAPAPCPPPSGPFASAAASESSAPAKEQFAPPSPGRTLPRRSAKPSRRAPTVSVNPSRRTKPYSRPSQPSKDSKDPSGTSACSSGAPFTAAFQSSASAPAPCSPPSGPFAPAAASESSAPAKEQFAPPSPGRTLPRSAKPSGRVPKAPVHPSRRMEPYPRPSKSSTKASAPSEGASTSSAHPSVSSASTARPSVSSASSAHPSASSASSAHPSASSAHPSASSAPSAHSKKSKPKSSTGANASFRESSPPIADPFFMSPPQSRNVGGPGAPSLGTPGFTFPAPPSSRRAAVATDPPTPTKKPGMSGPSSVGSDNTVPASGSSSSASTHTVRPSPKSPQINTNASDDVAMEDAFLSSDRLEKRRRGDDTDDASSPHSQSPPRKRGRELSPETLKANADLKRAERKRDRIRRSDKSEDDLSKQRHNQFWREVFDNVRRECAVPTHPSEDCSGLPPAAGQSSTTSTDEEEAHRASIEESRRKLAELEKDKPLWEAERCKREAAAAAEEQAREALREERRRSAAAAMEAKRCREAEAAAQAAELAAAEAAWRAQEYNRAAAKQRSENREAQRARWSPWNQSRALSRYMELSKRFDAAKFTAENPVDPLMIPWPVLTSPFSLDTSKITWQHVEAFFDKAKKTLRSAEYKRVVHASNTRFHPDTWKKLGVCATPDATLNAELERAAVIVSQQISEIRKGLNESTFLWRASATSAFLIPSSSLPRSLPRHIPEGMAQRPSNVAPYSFAARALIRPNKVTVLPYASPAGPDVVLNAVPTIMRCFYNDSRPWIKSEAPAEPPASSTAPRSSLRPSSRSAQEPTPSARGTPVSTVDSFTSSVPPSPFSESPSRVRRQGSVRASTPSPNSAPLPSDRSASTAKPTAPNDHWHGHPQRRHVTRSSSRASLQNRSFTPDAGNAASSPSVESLRLDDEAEDLGVKRTQKKCLQTDEEKARGLRFYTTWYSSKGDYVLSAPPSELLRGEDVKPGDIFFHVSAQSVVPQIWICTEQNDGSQWKSVTKGFIRAADKRRLIINSEDNGNKYPSFVTETWYNKRLKEERAQAKGKMKATR